MSGGLNRLFKASPRQFMATHAFNTNPHTGLASARARGLRELNLAFNGMFGQLAVTEVQPARTNRSNYSHSFTAYYLPWAQGKALSLQLGTGASYFFTAALTGCRLIIGGGSQPLVTHVDGGSFTDEQMDAMCAIRSNGDFSATRYWHNGAYYASIVVGVRNVAGWAFYAQSFNYNSTFPVHVEQV